MTTCISIATGILEKLVSLQPGNLTSIGKIGVEENKEYTKVLMAKLAEALKIPADRSVLFCFSALIYFNSRCLPKW